MTCSSSIRADSHLYHSFQCRPVKDHEAGALRLDELLGFEVGKQTADGLARRADHLRNLLVQRARQRPARALTPGCTGKFVGI